MVARSGMKGLFLSRAVSKKHGKLITFLRTFMKSRPTKQKLKQRGILKERVFGCDLGEHLLNSGHDGKEQPAPDFFLCWEFVRVIVAVQGPAGGQMCDTERETEADEKQTLWLDVGALKVAAAHADGFSTSSSPQRSCFFSRNICQCQRLINRHVKPLRFS